jgi:hypothetical protein
MPRAARVGTVLLVGLAMGVAGGPVSADNVFLSNGLAPPNPDNVIADATFVADVVWVRDLGCAIADFTLCPTFGTPTTARLEDGGVVDFLYVLDTSNLFVIGGTTNTLSSYVSASITMTGGTVAGNAAAQGDSTFTLAGGTLGDNLLVRETALLVWTGGTVAGSLQAYETGLMRIVGSDFAVGGNPVPFGPLAADSGTLTGVLESGQPINNFFLQGQDPPSTVTGTIELVEAPEPAGAILGAAALAALGLVASRGSTPTPRAR